MLSTTEGVTAFVSLMNYRNDGATTHCIELVLHDSMQAITIGVVAQIIYSHMPKQLATR
jgi:hypothetical protein